MRRWLMGLGAAVILSGLAVYLYPVGGQIWRSEQVDGLAVTRIGRRIETADRSAISEALTAARQDRFVSLFRAASGARCHPQDVAFLAGGKWIAVRLSCPNGFFLDFLPLPGPNQ